MPQFESGHIPPAIRVTVAAALLVVLWLGLPVRLPTTAEGASNDACLTRADRAPAGPAAIPELERCSTLAPDDPELWSDLGALYASGGQADKAEASYRRALAVDPDHVVVRLQLAELLLARGRPAEARALAQHALRLQPNRRAIIALIERADRVEHR